MPATVVHALNSRGWAAATTSVPAMAQPYDVPASQRTPPPTATITDPSPTANRMPRRSTNQAAGIDSGMNITMKLIEK